MKRREYPTKVQMDIASRKTKLSLMQNDKVLVTIEYIVFSLLGGVLGNVLRVLPLVKYLRLYSSFNLAARALRFTRSMFWRALGGTKRFLLRKERSPLIWAGVVRHQTPPASGHGSKSSGRKFRKCTEKHMKSSLKTHETKKW